MLRVSDEPQPRVFSVDDVEPKVGVMGMCVYVYMLRVPRVYTRDTMERYVGYGAPELDRVRVTRMLVHGCLGPKEGL